MRKLFIILGLLLGISSCKLGRFVYYNFADITDHKIFPAREIKNDENQVFRFHPHGGDSLVLHMKDSSRFEDYLAKNKTVAFLVIHNDTLKYQAYFNDYHRESIVASFSMAKSFTSFLIGCAIEDGYIRSVDEPVSRYLPELAEKGFDKVTIENLLQMTAGLDFNESYINPFGDAASFYYGTNLEKYTLNLDLKSEPNQYMQYTSGNTQILGLILDRALDGISLSQYLEEKLWSKVGMEYPASWSIDRKKDGLEKTFCCLNARAIDFAKFGRLYLKGGNWDGQQIVPRDWVERSTAVDTSNGSYWGYQYQWWLPNKDGDFIAEGILGQFIFVSPSENLIIVRLGEEYGSVNWKGTFQRIKEILAKEDS